MVLPATGVYERRARSGGTMGRSLFLIEKLKTFCHAFSKQHGVDDAFVRWKPTSSGPQCHFCLIFFR
jgi:hypothetical protein